MTWLEIFKTPNLKETKVGDTVVINIVNHKYRHSVLMRKTVDRTTPAYIWADGIKFNRVTGQKVHVRKRDKTTISAYALTKARDEYLQATGR